LKISTTLLTVALASVYFLLALQAEPITATLGYISGGLLLLATMMMWRKSN